MIDARLEDSKIVIHRNTENGLLDDLPVPIIALVPDTACHQEGLFFDF